MSLEFSPTADQDKLIDQLAEYLFVQKEDELFILRGYAGTGKTSMIGALTKVLPAFKMKSVLLAPTGRAAKVLSHYSKRMAHTIHRKIYRKFMSPEGSIYFGLAENTHKNTLFVVDEASMIGEETGQAEVRANLLQDLLEFVYSGENCKILFSGDVAQLPPVGTNLSPALNPAYLKNKFSFKIRGVELKEVVRQSTESGILLNATQLRVQLFQDPKVFPELDEFSDIRKVPGDELEDTLNAAYTEYGDENVLIITRSNKRANLFNQQVRVRIKYFEEEISAGDLMMVVKNNYSVLGEKSSIGFIANGDAIEILKVVHRKEVYGMHFAEVVCRLVDYPDEPEMTTWLNLSVVSTESPSMSFDDQRKFARIVLEDIGADVPRSRQVEYLRENPFYNALQVKFSYAVTCHKAQGGQWPCVFIDKGYLTQDMINEEYYRWLYTAITRATEKVYLINF